MQIKTFQAPTMREALELVRAEFGDGAAILHSRRVEGGRIKRLFRAPFIEIAATPDQSPLAEQAARSRVMPAAPHNRISQQLDRLDDVIGSLPEPSERRSAPVLVQAYGRLIDADVSSSLARRLLVDLEEANDLDSSVDPAIVSQVVRRSLEHRLSISGPIRCESGACRVVALVGPTGVGKTTTLAKLAANFRLQEDLQVGVITVDTYRTGAVEQRRTYAEIIDLPMEVVSTPAEMRAAVTKLAALDLVLVDTAGRSPHDEARLDELRELLVAAAPAETHLVLSTTATGRNLSESIERFGVVQPTSLLLTKLDESPSLGHVALPLVEASLPTSYLTDGQSVPEDIRIAGRSSLAAQLLGAGV